MTTIAEFLNRTSGNNSYGELYKEAENNQTQGQSQGFGTWLYNHTPKPVQKIVDNGSTVLNPTPDNVPKFFNDNVTWNSVNSALNDPKYAQYYTLLEKDKELQNKFVNNVRTQLTNHYVQNGKVNPEFNKVFNLGSIAQGLFSTPDYKFDDNITKKIYDSSVPILLPKILENPNLTYQTMYGYIDPNSQEATLLRRAVGDDPKKQENIGKIVSPIIQEQYNNNPEIFTTPAGIQTLTNAITPAIKQPIGQYLHPTINDGLNADQGLTEATTLNNRTFGNDEAYSGIMDPYYSEDKPDSSNNALAAIPGLLMKPELGVKMIDHLRELDPSEIPNSGIGLSLNYWANLAEAAGDTDRAQKLRGLLHDLPSLLGRKGETWMSSAGIYDYIRENYGKEITELGKFAPDWTNSIMPYDEYKRRNLQALEQDMRDNPWESGYYGFLKDPNIRRAVQYAAPWLMYGLPLAGIGSMLGTNSLWPLVLFGGLGSGVLGYGAQGFNWFSPETVEKMDSIFGKVNSPLSYLGNMVLPEGTSRDVNNLLTTPADQPIKHNPRNFMTEEELEEEFFNGGNPTAYNAPRFNSTGTAYTTPEDASRNSNYYVSRQNNPMAVGSMRLG